MRQPDIASESGLDALREEASRTGEVKGAAVVLGGAPFPRPNNAPGYYGIPLLKEPVWTWQVPLYFFVGGAAGASAVIRLLRACFRHRSFSRTCSAADRIRRRLALSIVIGSGSGTSYAVLEYASCFQAALPDVSRSLDVSTFLIGDNPGRG
jgi:hypothetical protein